ncbi:MAG: DMT family transporter [Clostridia bacterium]|nr:DMT family transporter [Clostridia bacterium]
MTKRNNIKGSLILGLAALIWGLAFVAQDAVADKMPPMAVNGIRSTAAFFLLALFFKIKYKGEKIFKADKKSIKETLLPGVLCGALLAVSTNLQQAGITLYPNGVAVSARAGFLTALYVIIVPLLSVFLKKKIKAVVWVAVIVAIIGVYLLCFSGGFGGVYVGDLLLIFCAVCFSLHIMTVDRFCEEIGGIRLSTIQFLFCGVFSLICSFIFEHKSYASADFVGAIPYLAFLIVFSSTIAYTLQIVGQKFAEPYIASLTMSLESVFAALGGWLILNNSMSKREIIGCVLVFAAIILAQIDDRKQIADDR